MLPYCLVRPMVFALDAEDAHDLTIAALKKKLGIDFPPYVILGACNPQLAHRALSLEPQIGLLLPCNVVVQQPTGGGVTVSIADPQVMFEVVDNPQLAPIAEEAASRLERAISALG